MRLVAPQDRKALKEWVEYHSAEGDFDKFMESLGSLPTGEAWVWSPEFMGIFQKVKIRARETFHPDREILGKQFQMPELERADVQEFIKEFQKEVVKDKPKSVQEIRQQMIEEKKESQEVISLKNEFESKLLQKDLEIRRRDDLINSIRKLLGGEQVSISNNSNNSSSSNVQMWLEKLGNGGLSKILKFLADKSGMKFSRSQIGLGVGLSAKSGSFNTYIATLKRNLLIKEEGGFIQINPDL
jgi:hypothetical protein